METGSPNDGTSEPQTPSPEGVSDRDAPQQEEATTPVESWIVGVRVRGQVRVSQFNSTGVDFGMGEQVVVEGDQGIAIGEVALPTGRARATCDMACMKKALRAASDDDLQAFERRAAIQAEASEYCRDQIRTRGLPMKLVRVEQSVETRKLTFYFTSDRRVDFRDLVRDLAHRLRTRIEMRQIGVRDEAGCRGGYGPCGKSLCCSTFMKEFPPISIRMAKAQKLSLNPSKLSGVCGRLKCCLRYEYAITGGDAAQPTEDEPPPASGAPAEPTDPT
jgi:cell fate regulator YaaT (PSP1 superfamily)